MNRLPTFLVIGAAKCGTTALHAYLAAHPQVFMTTPKEPMFFDCEGKTLPPGYYFNPVCTTLEDYQALFAGATPDRSARGEASTVYLYSPEAPGRIRRHVPDAKLVAILRDPAERAYSHYLYFRQHGREPRKTFAAALADEPERLRQGVYSGFCYRARGFYAAQLERYRAVFPPEQLRVHLYEDFCSDRAGVVRDILRFIGVDDTLLPDLSRVHNVTAVPRSRFLHHRAHRTGLALTAAKQLIPDRPRQRIRAWLDRLNLHRPPLSPSLRADLVAGYREDLLRLHDLLGRDLSAWLKA